MVRRWTTRFVSWVMNGGSEEVSTKEVLKNYKENSMKHGDTGYFVGIKNKSLFLPV